MVQLCIDACTIQMIGSGSLFAIQTIWAAQTSVELEHWNALSKYIRFKRAPADGRGCECDNLAGTFRLVAPLSVSDRDRPGCRGSDSARLFGARGTVEIGRGSDTGNPLTRARFGQDLQHLVFYRLCGGATAGVADRGYTDRRRGRSEERR